MLNRTKMWSLAIVATIVVGTSCVADAGLLSRALNADANSAVAAGLPQMTTVSVTERTVSEGPLPLCPSKRCIRYHYHPLHRKVCRDCCKPPFKAVVTVEDKCCGCLIEVPICVPACCEDAPKVSTHCGVFGRQVTEYCWCCGYRVKIVMDRCGDLHVHYFGL